MTGEAPTSPGWEVVSVERKEIVYVTYRFVDGTEAVRAIGPSPDGGIPLSGCSKHSGLWCNHLDSVGDDESWRNK